jgi:hypothetical protein
MQKLTMVLATGMLLSVVGMARSQAAKPPSMPASATSVVWGDLTKVDGTRLIVDAVDIAGITNVTDAPQPRREPIPVTVATDGGTQFIVDLEPGKLADLKPGMHISTYSESAAATQPARLVVVASSIGRVGALIKVDGKDLALRIPQPGGQSKDATVVTDEKTRVMFIGSPPQPATLADLRVGMRVKAIPETGPAVKIIILNMATTLPTSKPE